MNKSENTTAPVASAAPASPVKKAAKPTRSKAAAPPTATKPAKASAPKAATPAKATNKVQAAKPVVKVQALPEGKAASPPKTSATPAKPMKDKKVKVVRDSFTIPKTELLQIGEMKKRALHLGVEVKKSELIRAGLSALAGMSDAAFKKAIASVPTIKTGRPAKD